MAPKRKSSVQPEGSQKKRRGTGEEDSFRSAAEALRAAPAEQHIIRVDPACPLSRNPRAQVHEDYDCTLNQTNIGNNNNKFYIIQLLEEDGRFFCWNRWGRVVSDPPPMAAVPPPPSPPLLSTHFRSPASPSAVQRQSA